MPHTLDQAYGLLKSAKLRGRIGHAFLISGASGSGKEELAARIIQLMQAGVKSGREELPQESATSPALDSLQGEFVRIVKPRSKSRQVRVVEMRELEDSFYLSAPPGQWKIGVILDADRMNESASNAFLKTLEEPPSRSLLLLLSTAPDQLLTTIQSRCLSLPLYRKKDALTLSKQEQFIASLFDQTFLASPPSIPAALLLKSAFEQYVKEQKEAISLEHRAALKEENEKLKQVVERDYLKAKEDEAKALEASHHQALRSELMNTLIAWMGDALRLKVGSTPQTFQESIPALTQFTSTLSLESLLVRQAALEELLALMVGTNVHEALSLEIYFLRAYS